MEARLQTVLPSQTIHQIVYPSLKHLLHSCRACETHMSLVNDCKIQGTGMERATWERAPWAMLEHCIAVVDVAFTTNSSLEILQMFSEYIYNIFNKIAKIDTVGYKVLCIWIICLSFHSYKSCLMVRLTIAHCKKIIQSMPLMFTICIELVDWINRIQPGKQYFFALDYKDSESCSEFSNERKIWSTNKERFSHVCAKCTEKKDRMGCF